MIKGNKLLQVSRFQELGLIHNDFLKNSIEKFEINENEKSLSSAINSINEFNINHAKTIDYFKKDNSQPSIIFNASNCNQ